MTLLEQLNAMPKAEVEKIMNKYNTRAQRGDAVLNKLKSTYWICFIIGYILCSILGTPYALAASAAGPFLIIAIIIVIITGSQELGLLVGFITLVAFIYYDYKIIQAHNIAHNAATSFYFNHKDE